MLDLFRWRRNTLEIARRGRPDLDLTEFPPVPYWESLYRMGGWQAVYDALRAWCAERGADYEDVVYPTNKRYT